MKRNIPSTLKKKWYTNRAIPRNRKNRYSQVPQAYRIFPNQVGVPFVKGRGCQNCNLTGYRGRIGVFEMLELEQNMMDALRANDAVGFAQAARQSENYKPLLASAMELALQGVVMLREASRLVDAVMVRSPVRSA